MFPSWQGAVWAGTDSTVCRLEGKLGLRHGEEEKEEGGGGVITNYAVHARSVVLNGRGGER